MDRASEISKEAEPDKREKRSYKMLLWIQEKRGAGSRSTGSVPAVHTWNSWNPYIHLGRDAAMGQGMHPPHIWLCVPSPTKCTGYPKLTRSTWGNKAKMESGGGWWTQQSQQNSLCHSWKWLPLTTQPAFISGCELDHDLGGRGENCILVTEPSYSGVLRCPGKMAVWPWLHLLSAKEMISRSCIRSWCSTGWTQLCLERCCSPVLPHNAVIISYWTLETCWIL